jgi:hypothetical protein
MDFVRLDEDVLLLETKLTEKIESINKLLHSHHKSSEKNGKTGEYLLTSARISLNHRKP